MTREELERCSEMRHCYWMTAMSLGERKGTRTQDVQEARLPERERTEADGNKLVVQVPIGTGKTKTTELARLRKTY